MLPGAAGTFEFKPADWMEGTTSWWKDSDGVDPGTPDCHIGTDEKGEPNGRMFGEACLPDGMLVESNRAPMNCTVTTTTSAIPTRSTAMHGVPARVPPRVSALQQRHHPVSCPRYVNVSNHCRAPRRPAFLKVLDLVPRTTAFDA